MLIINNAGFINDNNSLYMSRSTGEFIEKFNKSSQSKLCLLQLEENGNIRKGINDFQIGEDIHVQTIPYFNGFKKVYSYLIAIKVIFENLRKHKGFTYIFYPGHVPLIVAYTCILFKKPFGLYVRGEYNSKISKPIFRRAKFINTVGTVFQNDIMAINSNCYIIKPMVQFDFSNKINFKDANRKREILFVGRIEKRKGVWEIVKAAKELKNVFPNYIFRLIGAGKDLGDIRKYVDENKLTNIILHGPVYNPHDLKEFYLQSEIFLFPSYDEGFPRVLYEAMYFRLPIITTFVGNIPGIMQDEYNCLKIENCSVNSIIEQVTKMLSSDLSGKLVENAEDSLSVIFNDSNIEHSELLKEQLVKL